MQIKNTRIYAIILSAGKGERMNSGIPKQYLMLGEYPVLYYSLKRFEDCPFVDEIILVAGSEDLSFCREQITGRYGFRKVTAVIPGGAQRYDSVWEGLKTVACRRRLYDSATEIVLIHDGARPLIDNTSIERSITCTRRYGACATGMPVKDTIKQCMPDGKVLNTPDRASLWQVQTPQTFDFNLVYDADARLMESGKTGQLHVTDDAMVVEEMTGHPVYMTEGSYANLKITTPEDLLIAEKLLDGMSDQCD